MWKEKQQTQHRGDRDSGFPDRPHKAAFMSPKI